MFKCELEREGILGKGACYTEEGLGKILKTTKKASSPLETVLKY